MIFVLWREKDESCRRRQWTVGLEIENNGLFRRVSVRILQFDTWVIGRMGFPATVIRVLRVVEICERGQL
jgi:hypothetical protein